MPPATGGLPPQAPAACDSTPWRDGGGGDAGGLRCRLCGLDEVPWPRTAYCSERCRRRAAYLARRRRHGAADRQDEARPRKGTRR